jgi:hypothetical protein
MSMVKAPRFPEEEVNSPPLSCGRQLGNTVVVTVVVDAGRVMSSVTVDAAGVSARVVVSVSVKLAVVVSVDAGSVMS